MKCKNCNNDILDNLEKCSLCGTIVNNDNCDKCPNCHSKIDLNMTKCMTCGFNLKTLSNSDVLLTAEQQKKLGKGIIKIFSILTFLPLVPIILVIIGMFLFAFVEKQIISITDIIIGIKYLLIFFSCLCFFAAFKKNNNIILWLVGILLILPVIYVSFFSKIGLATIEENIKIKNITIPTIYKYMDSKDSLLDFKLDYDELSDTGKKIKGTCVFSFYHEKISDMSIGLYNNDLIKQEYEIKSLEENQYNFVKNNDTNFIVINVDGSSVSYCVIDGKFEDLEGEWS